MGWHQRRGSVRNTGLCALLYRGTLSLFLFGWFAGEPMAWEGREGKLEMRRAWAVSLCVWSRIYPVKMAGVRRLNVSGIVDAVPSCCYDWW